MREDHHTTTLEAAALWQQHNAPDLTDTPTLDTADAALLAADARAAAERRRRGEPMEPGPLTDALVESLAEVARVRRAS